jgi:aspartyl-tRNA(Asn)/glutamyl-tRNA(Gln) amidotransferase subunit A
MRKPSEVDEASARARDDDPTLTETVTAIATGAVTSEQLVRASLDAIARSNARTGWFVRVEAERALAQARDCDRRRAAGEKLGALHGVPLAHKDMFARAGAVMECGSRIMRGYRPAYTATLIARLEAAGAVTLGALHMAEFALSPVGDNAHLGARPNPWNAAHVTGGSSSGSGAAVAARQAFAALGSDTGGSVRLPAACCGVAGLKPSQGKLPMGGVMPLAPSLDCAGFLARSAADCGRLLAVATGEEEVAPRDGWVVAVPTLGAAAPATDEVRAALAAASATLREAGCRVLAVPAPDLAVAGRIATLVLGVEAASVHGHWLAARLADYGVLTHRRISRGLAYSAGDYADALRLRAPLRREFLRAHLAGADALLLPILPEPVPTIAEATEGAPEVVEARIGDFSYWTRAINLLDLPALALPAGFTARGLPMGVQLIGLPDSDAALCQLGARFQSVSDWHRRRPPNPAA